MSPENSTTACAYSIADVLLHRPPMCWLDELIDVGPEHLTARLTIRADALFYEPGRGMPAWVGLEYMAQTAAAYSGYERVSAGLPPQMCLLLGTRHYRCQITHFPLGAILEVHAALLMRDKSNFVAFDCELRQAAIVIAQATVKAIQPDDVQAVLTKSFDAI
jgi:predicted hotdog family 3-hydroxylacyl-ACP dehydratase